MSIPGSSLLGVSETSRRLACTSRYAYMLVRRGLLEKPTRVGSKNFWSESAILACLAVRQQKTKPRRVYGARLGIERQKDHAYYWRAFRACTRVCGIEAATRAVLSFGVTNPYEAKRGELQRVAVALERMAGGARSLTLR